MNGKNIFTITEIDSCKKLIQMREHAPQSEQKRLRAKMRKIGFYPSDYNITDCKVSDLESLIRTGIIKVIDGGSSCATTILEAIQQKKQVMTQHAAPNLTELENKLIKGDFISVQTLSEDMIPNVSGIYCIKLRKGVPLAAKFGEVREDGIIYIGQASESLKSRLYDQELNHKRPATFFSQHWSHVRLSAA